MAMCLRPGRPQEGELEPLSFSIVRTGNRYSGFVQSGNDFYMIGGMPPPADGAEGMDLLQKFSRLKRRIGSAIVSMTLPFI